jgi:hypothetical protein
MKCKELAVEYSKTAMEIGRIRRKRFPDSRGELSKSEVEHVRSVLERQNPTNEDITKKAPIEVLVTITHRCNLPRYLECMKSGERGRFKLLMPFGTNKDDFKIGSKTKAVKVNQNGQELYIHSTLARKSWEYENQRGGTVETS